MRRYRSANIGIFEEDFLGLVGSHCQVRFLMQYLVHTAVQNIEGEISFEEANALLSERAFSFTLNEYLSIHRKLFTGYSSAETDFYLLVGPGCDSNRSGGKH